MIWAPNTVSLPYPIMDGNLWSFLKRSNILFYDKFPRTLSSLV